MDSTSALSVRMMALAQVLVLARVLVVAEMQSSLSVVHLL